MRTAAVADTAAAQAFARELLNKIIHVQDAPEPLVLSPHTAPAEAKHPLQGDGVL